MLLRLAEMPGYIEHKPAVAGRQNVQKDREAILHGVEFTPVGVVEIGDAGEVGPKLLRPCWDRPPIASESGPADTEEGVPLSAVCGCKQLGCLIRDTRSSAPWSALGYLLRTRQMRSANQRSVLRLRPRSPRPAKPNTSRPQNRTVLLRSSFRLMSDPSPRVNVKRRSESWMTSCCVRAERMSVMSARWRAPVVDDRVQGRAFILCRVGATHRAG